MKVTQPVFGPIPILRGLAFPLRLPVHPPQ